MGDAFVRLWLEIAAVRTKKTGVGRSGGEQAPGFMGLNYGWGTPVTTLLGQVLYGTTLGAFLQLQHANIF